jgi:hypothetical protein
MTYIFGELRRARFYAREHGLEHHEWRHITHPEHLMGLELSKRDLIVVLRPLSDDTMHALDLLPTRVRLP